jgi:hypothetical protein
MAHFYLRFTLRYGRCAAQRREKEKSVLALSRGADINKNKCIEAAPTFFIYIMHTEKGSLLSAAGLSRITQKSGA